MRPQSGSDDSRRCRDRPSSLGSEIVTFIETSNLSIQEVREGRKGRFFHSPNMTFAYYAVKAGAWIHEHSHPNDEVWNILDGQVAITIAGKRRVAGRDVRRLFPPDTAHSVKALADSRAIVVDYPRHRSIGGIAL